VDALQFIAPLLPFLFIHVSLQFPSLNLPASTSQVVLVTSDSWTSSNAALQMFSRREEKWIPVGDEIPVTLGRDGMAWGRGLQKDARNGPQKIEGDGRAPAGIFHFGTSFGYDSEPPGRSKLPYRQATESDYYVDDPESPEYNRWVVLPQNASDPHRLWTSFEKMRRADHLYEVGIVVEQNIDPVVKNRGSAIFFHVWRRPGAATAGCTAMSKENLLTLLRWLDPAKDPLLIQIPEGEQTELRAAKGGASD
jgi:L,D-peptidoglycan transpeptidase YkuD (ErfK/YbiS/YcfS/YnhG family)